MENSPGYVGKRLYLTKIREEKNSEQLFMLRRRNNAYDATKENLFLVTFNVDEVLPLICKEDFVSEYRAFSKSPVFFYRSILDDGVNHLFISV